MLRKILLALLWFPLTFILLIINLTLLASSTNWSHPPLPLSTIAPNENSVAAAGGTSAVLSANVIAGDARTFLLESFFKKNNSPMTPYTNLIVEQADKYGFDFRLVPAIAMCESNLGKHVPLKAGFNPFGIAVFTGTQSGKSFDSWQHAIEWVSVYIHDRYYAKGITTLHDIGEIWAPPSATNGGSWANCVEFFENSIF
ncbi:MAG: hypothetical protein NTY06_00940 [Candidatus Gottesmanbacteria bacterium]|nr:hypothetical protein [Candidatus Gottesmanbacteria bacterium]